MTATTQFWSLCFTRHAPVAYSEPPPTPLLPLLTPSFLKSLFISNQDTAVARRTGVGGAELSGSVLWRICRKLSRKALTEGLPASRPVDGPICTESGGWGVGERVGGGCGYKERRLTPVKKKASFSVLGSDCASPSPVLLPQPLPLDSR